MGDGQFDHNILKLDVNSTLTLRKLFEGKTWYSMIQNGNVLIMIRASQAVSVPCYTKPSLKIGIWIRISKNSSE